MTYTAAGIGPPAKSVAFEIVFMDENATITDERADLLFEKIVKALRDRRGARLRESVERSAER